jgi:hypothetical protein
MPFKKIDRREFMGLTTAVAGGVLSLGDSSFANAKVAPATPAAEDWPAQVPADWDPKRPLVVMGKPLRVQPVLMYRISEKRQATSWKSWGGVQSEDAASQEAQRISKELELLAGQADFPMQIHPCVKAKTAADAQQVHEQDYDVVIVYAAAGSGDLLKACFAQEKNRDTIIFVRHKSGPAYYWYEALSTKYLKTDDSGSNGNTHLDHGGVYVEDVVVDDGEELLWRLRALHGLKNFVGARIVALGGPGGKYSPEAPQVARERYGIEIVEVGYDDATQRIEDARKNSDLVARARKWMDNYLALPGTALMTDREYVANAFLLYRVFKDLMQEHNAPAFTIRDCMTKILPIAQTTPCLALSLLNDEGLMAFCESDFVVIPAGILLRCISGRPVFLHNSTFPHQGICTCAHCSAPRRMNGKHYEPVKVMTHYESEYGAAPKVELPEGLQVTFIDPQYSTGRWLGFTGVVKSNPFYEICRTQHDVAIQGDWRKLLNEVRDSHWMMAYGDCLKEAGYAARKLGVEWVDLSEA